ncbi:DNA-binding CsgD family transcriptional regulator [Pseudarthrobacter sp. SLBN-100]
MEVEEFLPDLRSGGAADEVVRRAGSGSAKAVLACDYGISRETVYQYLRHAKLD